ncbi:MAG: hypothetical protein OCD01_14480 [Fibrobacterales bacterium]
MNSHIARTAIMCITITLLLSQAVFARANTVTVHQDSLGFKIQVDQRDLFVNAVRWSHKPVGTNYNYDLWAKSDNYIRKVLTHDMRLLQESGATAIVTSPGIPTKWVTYVYKKFKIMTIVHWEMGRWGMTYNSTWNANPDFESPLVQSLLTTEITKIIQDYKDTQGFLSYAIGSSHNWGWGWSNPRINKLSQDDAQAAKAEVIYGLFGTFTNLIKQSDTHHPVTLVNGDIAFTDYIERLCPTIDIYGVNSTRGPISGGIFEQFKNEVPTKPFLYFTLGGNGAWDEKIKAENPIKQAKIVKSQLHELYNETYGKKSGVVVGAVMGWQDDWSMDPNMWQQWELDIHNNHMMEWQGLVAIAPSDDQDPRPLIPRPAFYVMKEAWTRLDPYAESTTETAVDQLFNNMREEMYIALYDVKRVEYELKKTSRVQMDHLEISLASYGYTNNHLIDSVTNLANQAITSALYFDTEESVTFGATGYASEKLSASAQLRYTGNVSALKLDQFDYNSLNKPLVLEMVDTLQQDDPDDPNKNLIIEDAEIRSQTLRLYRASFKYTGDNVDIDGYYRQGHTHWGHYGDFFNLYTEAYDYPTFDKWDMTVPYGLEITGKQFFKGMHVAVGPKAVDGANPSLFALYQKEILGMKVTPMIKFDFGQMQESGRGANAFRTSQYTLSLEKQIAQVTLKAGLIYSAPEKLGVKYETQKLVTQIIGEGFQAETDTVLPVDSSAVSIQDGIGAKIEALGDYGRVKFLALAQYMGPVAYSGWDREHTITDWTMKDKGGTNKFLSTIGFSYDIGALRIAPNLMYQTPIVEAYGRSEYETVWDNRPINTDKSLADSLRFKASPVMALSRKTIGGELVLTYDPTPNTKMWFFDSKNEEDALIAANLHLTYKQQSGKTDRFSYVNKRGYTVSFEKGQEPFDTYSAKLRTIYNPLSVLKIITTAYLDHKQSKNGVLDIAINGYGGSIDVAYNHWRVNGEAKINDWGAYDYMSEWNMIYPLQTKLGVKYGFSRITLFDFLKSSYIGTELSYRTIQYPIDENLNASETIYRWHKILNYELGIRTFITINI